MLSQLDKDDLEAIGLIKFDFLGLKTLTVIDKAVAAINRERAARGEAADRRRRDPDGRREDLRAAAACRTTAVFQLESLGMRDLIKKLQPDRFDDLTGDRRAVPPGPDADGRRSSSTASIASDGAVVDYLHPKLEGMLEADLRRDPVPRASDADRAGARGLLARRRGPAAARDGQEEARGDGAAARGVRQGRDRARRRARARGPHLRPDGDVRGLRLQQVARGRVRVDRVSDRVAQGAFHRSATWRRCSRRISTTRIGSWC